MAPYSEMALAIAAAITMVVAAGVLALLRCRRLVEHARRRPSAVPGSVVNAMKEVWIPTAHRSASRAELYHTEVLNRPSMSQSSLSPLVDVGLPLAARTSEASARTGGHRALYKQLQRQPRRGRVGSSSSTVPTPIAVTQRRPTLGALQSTSPTTSTRPAPALSTAAHPVRRVSSSSSSQQIQLPSRLELPPAATVSLVIRVEAAAPGRKDAAPIGLILKELDGGGIEAAEVVPGLAAWASGLKPGDRLLSARLGPEAPAVELDGVPLNEARARLAAQTKAARITGDLWGELTVAVHRPHRRGRLPSSSSATASII